MPKKVLKGKTARTPRPFPKSERRATTKAKKFPRKKSPTRK